MDCAPRVLGIVGSACICAASAPPGASNPPEAPAFLHIELEPHPEWRRRVLVRFRNTGDEPVVVLRPLDGSTWGWYWPVYRFHVSDAAGTALELGGRCGVSGLWAETRWPEDYIVSIPAGSTELMAVDVPFELERDATYTVFLEYIVDPGVTEPIWSDAFPVPAIALRGRVLSEPLEIAWEPCERYEAFARARHRFSMREAGRNIAPDAIAESESAASRALVEFAGTPPESRDQPSLERAQRLMTVVSFVGLPFDWLRSVLGEPTSHTARDAEFIFDCGVGWRVRIIDGRIGSVNEVRR